jgi:ABC-2 type transport system permease protein
VTAATPERHEPSARRSQYEVRENRTVAPGFLQRGRRVWEYRELLGSLTRRELKIKYKDSVLGFLWTLLNPLLYLVVFSIVFAVLLKTNVPLYGVFLLSGLLAWTMFSTGVTGATISITGNGPLVQKVWFPREILPLSAIGAALINFFFQFVVLVIALLVFQRAPAWEYLWLLVPALGVTIVWAAALGIVLSAVNVHYRDVQHFLELIFLAWFWLTPIVYQFDLMGDLLAERGLSDRLAMLNPMIPVVTTFQRVIYNPAHEVGTESSANFDFLLGRDGLWYLENLALSGAAAVVVLFIGVKIFGKLEADLGEEL